MAVVTPTIQNQVTELYLGFFGRAPDAAGFGYWTEKLANGTATVTGIANAFATTPEFVSNYGGLTPEQQVNKIYANVLNRPAEAGGLAYWTAQLNAGTSIGSVVWNIVNAAFSQVGTSDGLLVQNKVAVGEYFAITLASNDTASAATAYNLVTSNPASIAQAEATLVSATYTLTTGVDNVNVEKNGTAIVGTQSTFQANDTIAGNGKTNLQLKLTDTGTAAWTLPAAGVNGVQTVSLQNINGTAAVAGVTAVNEQQTVAVTGAAASTSTMYLGVATTVGASDSAAIVADKIAANKVNILAGATAQALGLIDITSNGAGTLTLTYSSTKGNVANQSASTSNGSTFAASVETVKGVVGVAAVAAANYLDTVNASNFVGATTFVSDNSTAAVTVNNLVTSQTVQVNGNGTATNGAFTADYKTTATGTANVNLSAGVRGATVTVSSGGTGITATTINSTGATNSLGGLTTLGSTLTINASSALSTGGIANVPTRINVSGAASNVTSTTGTSFNGLVAVDLGALGAAVTTVDASALSAGGVYAQLNTAVTSFTGGAGNDIVRTNGALPATAIINAGSGTDTLILNAATDVDTAAKAAKFSGFEVMEVAFAGNQDMSLFTGLTGVNLNNATAGAINMSATAAANIKVKTSQTAATLSLADATGSADVMSITVSSTTGAVNLAGLNVSGVETINYTNSSTGASTLSFDTSATSGVNTGLKTLNVSGAKGVVVELSTGAGAYNQAISLLTVDASALTAQATGTNTFTLQDTGAAHALKNGLTITGSGGDDIFTLNGDTLASGVVATINGGAGNDVFNVDAGQLYTASSGYLVINGGDQASSVGDKVNVKNTGGWTAADASFANMTGVEKLNYATDHDFSLTSGVFFNNAFATNGVTITADAQGATRVNTINLTAYTGNDTITLGTNAALTGAATVTGGSGNDTVNITSAATTTAGSIVVNTNAGNDTITIVDAATIATNAGVATINGGAGADTISLTGVAARTVSGGVTITTKFGESTFSAYDTVSGYQLGTGGNVADKMVFTEPSGTTISVAANIAAGSGVVGYTASQLTYGIGVATSGSGLLTFSGSAAAGLTISQVMSIVTSTVNAAQSNGATFVWADASGNSWLFNHASTDSVVELIGVAAQGVIANATTTANYIYIG